MRTLGNESKLGDKRMTKEELKKEAENWLRKYLLCCNCEKKCNCIDSNSYCEEQVLQAYVDSAEPREKRIAELKAQIEKMKRCEICKHYSRMCGCSYHSTSVKNCKENGMKLFELKEIKENEKS